MLIKTEDLKGFNTESIDDIQGEIYDFYFDDLFWNIQYLLIKTGGLLKEKSILMSHVVLGVPDIERQALSVKVSFQTNNKKEKPEELQTISESKEKKASEILNWPLSRLNLVSLDEKDLKNLINNMVTDGKQHYENENLHLRSRNEVLGYHIQAKNGEIGHVDDLIIETESWKIRYLIVDTRNWLPGGKDVLISPAWIEKIKWNKNRVYIDLKKGVIENSPPYDPEAPIDDQFELKLFKYYGRQRSENDN
jgi:sporulation protein YlmC with PRC-barrel domain